MAKRNTIVILSLFVILIGAGIFFFQKFLPGGEESLPIEFQPMGTLIFTSSAFNHNGQIPAKYTCDGEGVNPPLAIDGVPEGAKSLVLIVDDPDAPRGNWDHWVVWNIAPDTREIAEHSVPPGSVEGLNDFGRHEYGGPCPPSGTHRYQFKLYALDTVFNLANTSRKPDVEAAMEGHILAQTLLIGLYERQ